MGLTKTSKGSTNGPYGSEMMSSLLPDVKNSLFENHSSSLNKNETPIPHSLINKKSSVFAETLPGDTPSMAQPLSDTQIGDLLNKVNMKNVFLNMANHD